MCDDHKNLIMDNSKTIRDLIDRKRRDLINGALKNAKGEVSEMYYEGMRVAFAECQKLAESFVSVPVKINVEENNHG
jgi:hypothetical protein